MGFAGVGFMVAVVTLGQTEVGWDDVKALLSDDKETREEAMAVLEASGDPSLVAGINDLMYYNFVTRNTLGASKLSTLMESLTGEEVGDNPRDGWVEWIGRHEEIAPKKGYLAFKRWVFERYDPAFRGYFNPRFTFRIRPEEIEWGGVPKDGIPTLDQPGFIAAAKQDYLDDDDRVFGVYLNGVAKAYPHIIMDPHEMCNDLVGGEPVSLSYCTLCGSGVLYHGAHSSRERGKPFTFGSSGLLYRSNKLMYDRPTNSLWNNLTGEPIAGRLAESGIKLELAPLVVSTWGEWKKRHPETLVLDRENTGFARDYEVSPYADYFTSDKTMFPVWLRSEALATKQRVFTLVLSGRPKAYPVDILKEERITHDTLGSVDIVLLTNAQSGAVRAYRTKARHFVLVSDTELREEPPGIQWTVHEDRLESEDGSVLERVAGHDAFWFGWYAFYPSTEIYEERERP